MKRIIATILLGGLLLCCFASCDELIDTNEHSLSEESSTEALTEKRSNEEPTTEYNSSIQHEDLPFEMRSSSNLLEELKQKGINPNYTKKYTVFVQIITVEDKSVTDEFSIEKLTEILGDSDKAYEEHSKRAKEYFKSLNETVAEELGITELDYYASDYSPYILLEYNSVDEYSVCEKQLIEAIKNHSEILGNARVYISYLEELPEMVG